MKRLFICMVLLVLILLLGGSSVLGAEEHVKDWDNLFGGDDGDFFNLVIETSDGGYLAVGASASSFSGEISDINNGNGDGLIVKFDSSGNKVWDKLFGGSSIDYFSSVIEASDGGFIAVGGSTSPVSGDISDTNNGFNDGLIVKFDSSGNKVWDKLFGGSGLDEFNSVIETNDGGYIVVGISTSSASGDITGTGNGLEDGLIVKFDGSGNKEWGRLFGGDLYDYFYSVVETNDGGFVVAGESNSPASGDITDTENGNENGNESGDGLIVKFDSLGNKKWDNLFGGNNLDRFRSITETSDGGYIVVGSSTSSVNGELSDINNGRYDGLIVKFDSLGNKVWDKLFGGSESDDFYSVVETNDGGYIVAGVSNSPVSGDITDTNNGVSIDGLIVKFDSSGNKVWDDLFGGNYRDYFYSVIKTSDGGYLAVGASASSFSGEISDISNGYYDALIAKFSFSYTLSFDLNGGDGTVPDSQQIILGERGTVVTAPIRDGYTFKGWNTAIDGSGTSWSVGTTQMLGNDITLYAQWSEITHILSFDINGGDGVAPVSQNIAEGGIGTATTNPTRIGYKFIGWNTAIDGSGSTWDFSTTVMPKEDVILYAQWKEDSSEVVIEPVMPESNDSGASLLPKTGENIILLISIGIMIVGTTLFILGRKRINK